MAKRQFEGGWIPPTAITTSAEIVIALAAIHVLVDIKDEHHFDRDLVYRVLYAVKEGREPSEEERAAMQTYAPICAHLAQLAGFSTYAELQECMERWG